MERLLRRVLKFSEKNSACLSIERYNITGELSRINVHVFEPEYSLIDFYDWQNEDDNIWRFEEWKRNLSKCLESSIG